MSVRERRPIPSGASIPRRTTSSAVQKAIPIRERCVPAVRFVSKVPASPTAVPAIRRISVSSTAEMNAKTSTAAIQIIAVHAITNVQNTPSPMPHPARVPAVPANIPVIQAT